MLEPVRHQCQPQEAGKPCTITCDNSGIISLKTVMSYQCQSQRIWKLSNFILGQRALTLRHCVVGCKNNDAGLVRVNGYLPSCRLCTSFQNASSAVSRSSLNENCQEMKGFRGTPGIITLTSKYCLRVPGKNLHSEITSEAGDDNEKEAIGAKVQTKRKNKPISEMMKVIRDKKMLERYQENIKKRKDKTSSANLPVIAPGSGYKDQLIEYISRHDETWEDDDFHDCEFAVSKSGKVMMFPLNNLGIFSKSIQKDSSEGTKIPSVTTILHVTRPMKQALSLLKWENKMIAELGEEGFRAMKQEMFDQGHSIHRSFEKYLLGTFTADLDLTPETVGFWESSKEVIQRIKLPAGFEIKVNHPALSYSGYIDCIAEVDGKLTLIELKTARKPKLELKNNEDYALQLVAYLGALNFDPAHHFQIEQVMIIVVYKDGMEATVHKLDEEACNHFWIKWLGRLLEYEEIADMKKAYVKRKIIAWSKRKAAEKERQSLGENATVS